MLERKKICALNDYFSKLNDRAGRGVYFYRINFYDDSTERFIEKYYEYARLSGIVIEGRIPNPNEKNLSYYSEIMGMSFHMNVEFIANKLKKWIPRMNVCQREDMALSFYKLLLSMSGEGKSEAILKNAYIKFMCWLYYKFERILNRLGENEIPKILYEGEISRHELLFLSALSGVGCDVVLLQYGGDENYLKIDPDSKLSDPFVPQGNGGKGFPQQFSLKSIHDNIQRKLNAERIYGAGNTLCGCVNEWTDKTGIDAVKVRSCDRTSGNGEDYCSCFYRINGADDKLLYLNELYRFYLELKNDGRKIVIFDGSIPPPEIEEINSISRKNYNSYEQLIADMSCNIKYSADIKLQNLMKKVFAEVLSEEAELEKMNINKLMNKSVYVLCWLERYKKEFFYNRKERDVSCCVYMGGCKNKNEALFLRILCRLPVDVLILVPDLNETCVLRDKKLCEINYNQSLSVEKFPRDDSDFRMGTAAYHAERELDTIMYGDSGLYRNQQFDRANVITLKTMYEEIALLWNAEIKYRPNFSTVNGAVNMPVIFAKVSGVKDGDTRKYWRDIKELVNDDAVVIKNVPYIKREDENPIRPYAVEFLKDGRLLKNKIKGHKCYGYGFLREEIQDYILDKLQLLIERKSIKGMFENGAEYTAVAVVLNIKKEILRIIQKFDFTKKNPKIIYINTTETVINIEDSILIAFLNLVGFDIVFFVPTGYQSVEKFFDSELLEEHQIGEYMYDLNPPDFGESDLSPRLSWREKIFGRSR